MFVIDFSHLQQSPVHGTFNQEYGEASFRLLLGLLVRPLAKYIIIERLVMENNIDFLISEIITERSQS